MLDHVRGTVLGVAGDAAILSIGGIGLRVQMPTSDLASLRGEATVYTILQSRDDELHLYGFCTERGRELYRALTSVTGIGPKAALTVLSVHPPDALERVIAAGDAEALGRVPGLGPKKAARIVLELRGKLTLEAPREVTGSLAEVRDALRSLGYAPQEVQDVIADLPADGDSHTLLRFALRSLGNGHAGGVDR